MPGDNIDEIGYERWYITFQDGGIAADDKSLVYILFVVLRND